MQLIRPILALGALLLAASCAPDAGQLTAPNQPLRSAGTRTYTLYAITYRYNYTTRLTEVWPTFNAGYIQVDQVSDADGSESPMGTVQSGGSAGNQYFTKADGHSLRLTAVPTAARCSLWYWVLKTPSGSSLSIGGRTAPPTSINMDSYSQYSYARAEFFCS